MPSLPQVPVIATPTSQPVISATTSRPELPVTPQAPTSQPFTTDKTATSQELLDELKSAFSIVEPPSASGDDSPEEKLKKKRWKHLKVL